MVGGRIDYTIGYKVDKSGLNEIQNSLKKIKELTSADVLKFKGTGIKQDELVASVKEAKQLANEVEKAFKKAYNPKIGGIDTFKLNKSLKDIGVDKIVQSFSQLGPVGQQAINQITASALKMQSPLRQVNKALDGIVTSMKNTVVWGMTSGIWNNFVRGSQQAIDYVKNLDSSLNDIRIVTGKSAEEMDKFAVKANNAAKSLGAASLDYTKASLIYYQQGLSDEDVAARTDVTLKAANVTGQTGDAVSEQLTAVWNGYKVSAQEAELYIDKVAAVAASTASDLEELSTGMSKVASAANLMGVDIDQLNAQMATIISVTRQAPESVGTALKTIYARMGDIKAGVDTETTLGKYTEKMAAMGFSVLDMNGNLRDMGEVIEEIGSKWTDLSREQQIALSQTMAGTRQYNNLLSLFDNWDSYTAALNTSKEATGTLQKQQDIYMESTEGHIKTLQTSVDDLYDSLFNSKGFNIILDGLTAVSEGVGSFVDLLNQGGGALLNLGAIATRVLHKQIGSGITSAITGIKNIDANAKNTAGSFALLDSFKQAAAGPNVSESAQQIIGMSSQTAQLSSILSDEELNKLNTTISQIASLDNALKELDATINEREADIKEATSINDTFTKSFEKTIEAINTADTKTKKINAFNNLKKEAEKTIQEIDPNKLLKKFTLNDKGLDSITKTFSSLGKNISEKDTNKLQNLFKGYNSALEKMKKGERGAQENLNHIKQIILDTFEQLGAGIKDKIGSAMAVAEQEITEPLNGVYDAVDKTNEKIGDLNKSFGEDIEGLKTEKLIGQFADLTGAVVQFGTTTSGLINTFRQIADGEIDAAEALPGLIMGFVSLMTTIPSLVKDGKLLVETIKGLNLAETASNKISAIKLAFSKKEIVAEGMEAGATAANTAATNADTAANYANAASQMAKLGPIGWIILALGALAAATWICIEASQAEARAIKKAEERAKEASDAYNQLKQDYNDLKNSIEGYDEALKSLDDIVIGTEEWANAVEDVNQKVQDLLDKYPELEVTYGKNGIPIINEEQLNILLEEEKKKKNAAQTLSVIQNKEVQDLKTNSKYNELELYNAVNEISSLITMPFNSDSPNISNVAKEVFEELNSTDKTAESLEEVLNKVVANSDQTYKDVLADAQKKDYIAYNTIDSIEKIVEQLKENQKTNDAALNTLSNSILADRDLSGYTEEEVDAISDGIKEGLSKGVYTQEQKNSFNRPDKRKTEREDILKELEAAGIIKRTGKDVEDFENAFANVTGYKYSEGSIHGDTAAFEVIQEDGSSKKTTYQFHEMASVLRRYLAENQNTNEVIAEKITTLQNEANGDTEYYKALLAAQGGLGKDEYGSLSLNSINKLINTVSDIETISDENEKKAEKERLGLSNLTEEELSTIKENAEKAIEASQEEINRIMGKGNPFTELFNTESLSPDAVKNLEKLIENAFASGGHAGINQLSKVLASVGEEADKIRLAEIFKEVDWSSISALDKFKQLVTNAGIELDYTDENLQNYITSLKNAAISTGNLQSITNELRNAFKTIRDITKDIKLGSIISDEDYQSLLKYNSELAQYFSLTAEGYKFIGGLPEGQSLFDMSSSGLSSPEEIAKMYADKRQTAQNIIDKEFDTSASFAAQRNALLSLSSEDRKNIGISEDFLNSFSYDEKGFLIATQEQIDELNTYFQKAISLTNDYKNGLLDIEKQEEFTINTHASTIAELDELWAQGTISAKSYSKHIKAIAAQEATEQLGISLEEFEIYVDTLEKKFPEIESQYEGFSAKLALANMRMNQGLKELNSNYKSWIKTLTEESDTSPAYAKTLSEMQTSVANLVGYSGDASEISSDFLLENKDLVYNIVIDGDYDKLKDLQAKFAEDQLVKIVPDLDTVEFDNAEVDIETFISKVQNAINDAEIGDKLPEKMSAAIFDMIKAAGENTDQLIAVFEAMGLQAGSAFKKALDLASASLGDILTQPSKYNLNGTALSAVVSSVDNSDKWKDMNEEERKKFLLNSQGISVEKLLEEATKSLIVGNPEPSVDLNTPENKDQGKEKEAQKLSILEDEADRYHDINLEITKLVKNIAKLEEEANRLTGAKRVEKLKEIQELLEKQVDAEGRKLEIMKQEKDDIKTKLTTKDNDFTNKLNDTLGKAGLKTFKIDFKFNEDGTVANYQEVITARINAIKQLQEFYNRLTAEEQEKYKDIISELNNEYKDLISLITNMETIISETIPEQEAKIRDLENKKIETAIEEFDYKVQLKLDLKQAERDWNTFVDKVINKTGRFKPFGENLLIQARSMTKSLQSFGGGDGTLNTLLNKANTIAEEIGTIGKGGKGDIFGDDMSKALEAAKNIKQEMMDSLESVEDMVIEVQQMYLNMIDEANSALDDHAQKYSFITEQINHNMKLIELINGDDSYQQLGNYYNQLEQNYNSELNFLKQEIAFWEEQMSKEEVGSEAWEKYRQNWQSAVQELNSTVESAVDNLINQYKNKINQIFDEMNKKFTNGKGLDFVKEEWDLINQNADRYLDKINAAFAIEELQAKYQKSINNSDNVAVQERLTKAMNEQLKSLREKEKLTKYDVDRANLLYDIELKKIALEEAQKNKTTARLRRDSQGNYSYQYVADQDAVAEKQQELNAALNSLYNLDKDQYRKNLDEAYQIYSEFQDKIRQLYEDTTLSDEERERRKLLYIEEYNKLIEGITRDNETVKQNLQESTFENLAAMYDTDVDYYKNMSDAERDILLQEMVPQWNTSIQEMIDKFASEDGFGPTCKNTLSQLEDSYKQYLSKLQEMAAEAGIQLDAITNGHDAVLNKMKEIIQTTEDELLSTWEKNCDEMKALADELQRFADVELDRVRQDMLDAATALQELIDTYNNLPEDTKDPGTGDKDKDKGSNNNPLNPTPPPSSNGGNGTTPSKPKKTPTTDEVKGVAAAIWRRGNIAGWSNGSDRADKLVDKFTKSGQSQIQGLLNDIDTSNKTTSSFKNANDLIWSVPEGDLTKYYYSQFKTGGYTGEWGNDGRMAMLHEKELVLNQQDTKNILSAVDIVRGITDFLNQISSFNISSIQGNQLDNTQTIEQNVHIEATFPNVSNSNEIEIAINNLVNRASQRATTFKR